MCPKNLIQTKKFDKTVDEDFSSTYDSFDNALQQVVHLYLPLCVSRERVHPY